MLAKSDDRELAAIRVAPALADRQVARLKPID
jgi:hypothetical protein